MSSVLSRLQKRRASAIEIDGETFYVRAMTIGELRRVDALVKEDADKRTGFVVGCTLCADAEGAQALPPAEGETDAAWADRVLSELADVPTSTIAALSKGVADIGRTPKLETIAKNSPGTQQPA